MPFRGGLEAQTTVTIGSGSGSQNYIPTYSNNNYSITQQIYTAEEIGNKGTISSVAFYNTNTSNDVARNIDIYMLNSTKTSFASTSDWVTVDDNNKVFSGTVTFTKNAWTTIETSSFTYNGTSLIIVVKDNTGSKSGYFSFKTFSRGSSTYDALYKYRDDSSFDPSSLPSGSRTSNKNQIQLSITVTYPKPTNITESDPVGTTSTVISWEAPTAAGLTGYAYQYKELDSDWTNDWTNISALSTSCTLNSLTPGTDYNFRIKAIYDSNESTIALKDFTTDCVTLSSFPQTWGFERIGSTGSLPLPNCWARPNGLSSPDIYYYKSNAHSGNCSMRFMGASTYQAIGVLPEMGESINCKRLSFYAKHSVSSETTIIVGYMTDPTDKNTFTAVENGTFTVNGSYNSTAFVVDFEEYTGDPRYIAIKSGLTSSGSTIYVDDITLSYIPTFTTSGNWNVAENWLDGSIPSANSNVIINATCTIPNDYTATANKVSIDGGSLTIADGGQLICNNAVNATVHKTIAAWNTGLTGGWYFIASPINVSDLAPTNVTNMISDANAANGDRTYDLYSLENITWHNYRAKSFNLANGQGYLYASEEGADLQFSGAIKVYDADHTISVSEGWNLIGNPYTFEAYPNQAYYTITDANSGITAQTSTSSAVVAPCTGIIVKAAENGTVKFLKDAPETSANNGNLQMVLAHKVATRDGASVNKNIDNAIVSFNEGSQLEKFYFGNPSASIFIPQNGEDYAIAFSDRQGDVPLNFKANETGTYTISFAGDEMDLNGIYLIDILAEEEIDLSVNPSYTFIGSPADRMARFKIVFRNTGGDGTSDIFAYQNGNDIIVSGEGELQIFDVMGRMVSRQYVSGVGTINAMPYGVYIFKLNGMTQKIVVR